MSSRRALETLLGEAHVLTDAASLAAAAATTFATTQREAAITPERRRPRHPRALAPELGTAPGPLRRSGEHPAVLRSRGGRGHGAAHQARRLRGGAGRAGPDVLPGLMALTARPSVGPVIAGCPPEWVLPAAGPFSPEMGQALLRAEVVRVLPSHAWLEDLDRAAVEPFRLLPSALGAVELGQVVEGRGERWVRGAEELLAESQAAEEAPLGLGEVPARAVDRGHVVPVDGDVGVLRAEGTLEGGEGPGVELEGLVVPLLALEDRRQGHLVHRR